MPLGLLFLIKICTYKFIFARNYQLELIGFRFTAALSFFTAAFSTGELSTVVLSTAGLSGGRYWLT